MSAQPTDPARSGIIGAPPRFLLNDTWVTATPGSTVLAAIRDQGLTATKPGCHTGDCGACVVAVAEPAAVDAEPSYRAVNSCLMLVEQVAGCQVITAEGLRGGPGQPPHPVAAALVEAGAIQCGYCTPGLVMALVGGLAAGQGPHAAAAGNLCRCTGYAAISTALDALASDPPVAVIPEQLRAAARALPPTPTTPVPATATALAGATDWAPSHTHRRPCGPPLLLRRVPGLCGATETDHGLRVAAATTVAELGASPVIAEQWPELAGYLELFASPPVRNLATVGGNLANGSPSADLAVLLLAMGADLELGWPGRAEMRVISLPELHLGYRVTALAADELILAVRIPARPAGCAFSFDKVTRRRTDDIAAVNLASVGWLDQHARVGGLRLAAGGIAATPKLLATPAEVLLGHQLTPQRFATAVRALGDVISPISDVHGSASYRAGLLPHLIAGQLAVLDPGFDPAEALAGIRA